MIAAVQLSLEQVTDILSRLGPTMPAVIASLGTLAGSIAVGSLMQARSVRIWRKAERLRTDVRDMLDSPERNIEQRLGAILRCLGEAMGAERAWLLIDLKANPDRIWSERPGFAPIAAEAATLKAVTRFPWRKDRILVAPGGRGAIVCSRLGVIGPSRRVGLMLLRSGPGAEGAILGLSGGLTLRIEPDMMDAVATVLGETVKTLRRQSLERRYLEHGRKAAIERRMETIGTFASGAAHNLNNIIAAIAGFNALIELHVEPDSAVGRSAIDIAIAIRRAQTIIQEMLNFGRRMERTTLVVDVGELLAETAAMLAVSLPARIHLEMSGLSAACRVSGDFDRLQQVLLNISNNAAQAMPGGGTIRWFTRHVVLTEARTLSHAVLQRGNYVTLRVADEGRGMSPALTQRIFDPFFTTRSGGTGLGLSTAREIVEHHGGAIDVRSLRGKGSDFTLWLPAAVSRSTTSGESTPLGRGEIVLIVNADPVRLAIDEEVVAALGYEPSGLADVDAIDDFEGYADIVLAAGMVEGDTIRTLEGVRAAQWNVPILTAVARPATGLEAPALDYPLQPVELAVALSAAVGEARERRAGLHRPYAITTASAP